MEMGKPRLGLRRKFEPSYTIRSGPAWPGSAVAEEIIAEVVYIHLLSAANITL